jgi:hypothetical protein
LSGFLVFPQGIERFSQARIQKTGHNQYREDGNHHYHGEASFLRNTERPTAFARRKVEEKHAHYFRKANSHYGQKIAHPGAGRQPDKEAEKCSYKAPASSASQNGEPIFTDNIAEV